MTGLPAYKRERQCSKQEQQNHLFTHQNTNLNINYFKVSSKDTIQFGKWNVATQVLTCSACPSVLELSFGLGRTCHFCKNNKSLYRLSGGFGEFMLNCHFISNSPETPSNDCVKKRLIIVATAWQRQPGLVNLLHVRWHPIPPQWFFDAVPYEICQDTLKRTWLIFVGFHKEQNCCTPSTSFVLAQYQSAICPEKPTIGRFWFSGAFCFSLVSWHSYYFSSLSILLMSGLLYNVR